MSVNSKMTAIADKVRALLGISGKIGLDAMEDNLGTAVEACDSQAALIAQIKTALEGKVAGGNLPSAVEAEFGREPVYEQAPEGKSYFNGVLLPDFPATGFESCPYLMVLFNSSGKYYAYGSTSVPYFTYRDAAKSLELPAGRNRCAYDPATDSWGEEHGATCPKTGQLFGLTSIFPTVLLLPRKFILKVLNRQAKHLWDMVITCPALRVTPLRMMCLTNWVTRYSSIPARMNRYPVLKSGRSLQMLWMLY